MELTLTDQAIDYIDEKKKQLNDKLVIKIYQFSKASCSGSYLDFYVELDKYSNTIQNSSYEKWTSITYNNKELLDIYIEARIKDEFKSASKVLIDARVDEKLGEIFTELFLREKL